MNQPTEESIRTAADCLARAALFDDRIPDGDRERIFAWADTLQAHQIDIADAMAAVTRHYSTAGAQAIRPGDVITTAREIRRDRAEREKAHTATTPTQPDTALAGLPIAGANGKPIWEAYEINDAISRDCPHCEAPAEHACISPITRDDRKIPCLSRMKVAS